MGHNTQTLHLCYLIYREAARLTTSDFVLFGIQMTQNLLLSVHCPVVSPQLGNVQGWETLEHSVLNGISLLIPFTQDSGNYAKGGRKIVKASEDGRHQGDGVFQTQKDRYTYEHSQIVAACMGPAEGQARWGPITERLKWTLYPIPNQKAIPNWQLLAKEKLVFSTGVLLDVWLTLEGRLHAWK